jgi:hypothetical protein
LEEKRRGESSFYPTPQPSPDGEREKKGELEEKRRGGVDRGSRKRKASCQGMVGGVSGRGKRDRVYWA